MQIRLSDEDRERYDGCPEYLTWDPSRLSLAEAEELQERTGVVPFGFQEFLASKSAAALRCVVWLSLTRAGVDVAWPDVVCDTQAVTVLADPEPEGKAAGRSTRPSRSGSSAKSTPRP